MEPENLDDMSGSDVEPTPGVSAPVVDQMREAIDRVREQAWMVAPLTSPVALPVESGSDAPSPKQSTGGAFVV